MSTYGTEQITTLPVAALVNNMVLFTDKAWHYADVFQKKYPQYIPLKSKKWDTLVMSGVRMFVVTSLNGIQKVSDFVAKHGIPLEECQIWYASPLYQDRYDEEGYHPYHVADVVFHTWSDLENAVFFVEHLVYINVTKFANELDGYPILYEENLKDILEAGFNKLAFDARGEGLKKISEYITSHSTEELDLMVYLIYFNYQEYNTAGFNKKLIKIST